MKKNNNIITKNKMVKMPITPNRLVVIRSQLSPLAEPTGVDMDDVIIFIREKDKELGGIVSEDGIVKLAKKHFGLEEKEQIKKEKEIIKEEKIEMKNESMEEFWEGVEFTERKEFPPFLVIKNGITFRLKLSDPKSPPRPHVDKTYGTPQFLWDVVLTAIDSEIPIDEGLYQVGREYTLALNANRATKRFKEFWIDNGMKVDEFVFKRTGKSFQTDYVFKNVK